MRTLGEALIMEAVEGRWFRGLRKALQSFLEVSAHRVSGDVRFTLRNGGFELAGLKAVSPLYIRDREQWEYAKAAAARSITTSRFEGSSILTEQGRGTGLGRRGESLDAALKHRANGEKAMQVRESLPRDTAAHRLSPNSLPAPPDDPNSTTSLD
jgi:argininosuccinate synthase